MGVRIDTTDDGASGIRFDSLIDKSIYDGLTEMNGVSVELGTVIAPSANIAAVADCHDKIAALEAGGSSTYVAVPYKNAVRINDQYANDDGYLETAYYFSGAVAKIHSNNFLLDYTAVGMALVISRALHSQTGLVCNNTNGSIRISHRPTQDISVWHSNRILFRKAAHMATEAGQRRFLPSHFLL